MPGYPNKADNRQRFSPGASSRPPSLPRTDDDGHAIRQEAPLWVEAGLSSETLAGVARASPAFLLLLVGGIERHPGCPMPTNQQRVRGLTALHVALILTAGRSHLIRDIPHNKATPTH